MKLSIVIVHYKTEELTLRCLQSVFTSICDFSFEVLVVDNNSQDNAEIRVLESFPSVKWITNSYNAGFGRANNLGVAQAQGKYLLLLNSDMLLREDSLQKCMSAVSEISNLGVYGCQLLNEDGSLQKSVYDHITSLKSVLKNNILFEYCYSFPKGEIEAVMGAFFVLEKEVFVSERGFDPDFFMYAEELDLCLRIKKQNRAIVYDTSFSVIHKHGGSAESSAWSTKQAFASSALLIWKQKGIGNYLLYLLTLKLNFLMNLSVLWKMDKAYRKDFWKEWNLHFQLSFVYMSLPFRFTRSRGEEAKQFLKV